MVWKMSIDLSRPAVSSMGNLDPYDGLVTCTLLQQAADRMGLDGADALAVDQGAGDCGSRVLQEQIADFQGMVDARYKRWVCAGWQWDVLDCWICLMSSKPMTVASHGAWFRRAAVVVCWWCCHAVLPVPVVQHPAREHHPHPL
jgi:hypothetical protein